MSGTSWEIVFLPLVFVAMWASRPPVDRYLASLETPPRVWEGLVQFTPGYFGFHSRRLHLCEALLGRISEVASRKADPVDVPVDYDPSGTHWHPCSEGL